MSIRSDIFGWFDNSDQEKPAHDPGLETICPICAKKLSRPLMTISLMSEANRDKSYFYRVHKNCYDDLTTEEEISLDSSLIDALP